MLGATPRMAGTPQRSGGGVTPGRSSVRDKLNINPEEALMDEYEAGYGAKQQQARIYLAMQMDVLTQLPQYCTNYRTVYF